MRKEGDFSEFGLELYVLGELPADEAARIEEASRRDPALAARIAAIRGSNGETLEAYPSERMAKEIEARARKENRIFPPLRILSAAAVLAVGIGLGLVAGGAFSSQAPGLADTRIKGSELELTLFRKTDTGFERLSEGALAKASDLLQIGYRTETKGYGAIFSIDGRGVLTFHLPAVYEGSKAKASEIASAGEELLPVAYELDDAPRFERFFFVFSDKPFELSGLEAAARALEADPLTAESKAPDFPSGLAWCSFLVKKEARP